MRITVFHLQRDETNATLKNLYDNKTRGGNNEFAG